jgi:rod shape-determining protein MreD
VSIILGIPLLVVLAITQSTIINDLRLLEGRPDLILIAVVSWGIIGRHKESMVWGLVGGLALDLLSGLPLGVTAINLILIAFLVSFSEGRFWESHILMPLGVMLLASPLFYILSILTLWTLGYDLEIGLAMSRVVLPGTFLNLLLILPGTQIMNAIDRLIHPPEVSI